MGSKHVVWLTIVWVVSTEDGDKALIEPVDEIFADGHREASVFTKWANTLIIL